MAMKRRKPAVESRVGHARGAKPRSPIDDFGKWATEQGAKIAKKEIQTMKRYARGIGWAGDFERKGLDVAAEKAMGKSSIRRYSGKNTTKKLADHKIGMYWKKQDKFARTYGDYNGPHDRFFSSLDKGKANSREFNSKINKAWRAEVEIGRQQSKRTAAATRRALKKKGVR